MCINCKTVYTQRGISLVELIIFIVIVSVALIGLLSVMNIVTRGSADPMINKQAMAVADSLLEEVQLQDFVSQSGATAAVTLANRTNTYHIVSDYNGFSMPSPPGIYSLNDAVTPVAGLTGYSASVTVASQVLGAIPVQSAVVITVTVTTPAGDALQTVGYRAAY